MIHRLYAILRDATWGSNTAAAECAITAAAAAYLGRDRAGRVLARWWHRHHGEQLRSDLAAMEDRLRARISAQAAGREQEDR